MVLTLIKGNKQKLTQITLKKFRGVAGGGMAGRLQVERRPRLGIGDAAARKGPAENPNEFEKIKEDQDC
jgi:hypothetical protein